MTLEKYLKDRWERLTPESKRLLGLTDVQAVALLHAAWEMQYYRDQIDMMQREIDELRRQVKVLWPIGPIK